MTTGTRGRDIDAAMIGIETPRPTMSRAILDCADAGLKAARHPSTKDRRNVMDELRKKLVEGLGLADDRAEAAIQEVLAYLEDHLPEPAATLVADFAAGSRDPDDADRTKKVTTAAMAATTAAVNAVVLPGAR